jgi:hypothetical protein
MNERIINLIDRLKVKTESGELKWEKTSRENEFKIDLQNGAVSTDIWEEQGSILIDFRLFNADGEQIGSWVYNARDIYYETLSDLHSIIVNKYLRIDETLDGLLDELN